MSKAIGASIYCASDKNVYDALHNKKINRDDLVNYLLDFGIILSPNADESELIDVISSLPFDFHSYMRVSSRLEVQARKDNMMSVTLNGDFNLEELADSVDEYKESINDPDERCTVTKGKESIIMDIKYTDLDFSKTEMAQRSNRRAQFEISLIKSGARIRYPSGEKGKKILDRILVSLSEKKDDEIDKFHISLYPFVDPEARTHFFEQVLLCMPGYKCVNVTGVDIHKLDNNQAEDLSQEEVEGSEFSSQHNDESDEEEREDAASFIEKATLKGISVLTTPEYHRLVESGFYIYYLVWQVVPQGAAGDKIEFEAKFSDPRRCDNFVYSVRGIYNFKGGRHNKHHRPPNNEEKREYMGLLEASAKRAFEAVEKNFGDKGDEDKVDQVPS